jgi:hypothetical protein
MDIKCPMTLKSFCQLVDPLYNGLSGLQAMDEVRRTHKDGDKYYWQLVSNAILTGSSHAELIVYVPYQSELQAIKSMCEGNSKAYFIWASSEDELPYLPDGGYYRNLNVIRFEVPHEDQEYLRKKVLAAGALLCARDGKSKVTSINPETITLQKIA